MLFLVTVPVFIKNNVSYSENSNGQRFNKTCEISNFAIIWPNPKESLKIFRDNFLI